MTTPRRLAWDVLRRVHRDDAYSHLALGAALDKADLDARDRGLVAALVYGVLTWERALDRLLDRAATRGLAQFDPDELDALRLGAYQLRFLDRVPDHASIHETVELVREVGGAPATANAVLRKLAATRDAPWWGAHPERKPARWLGERWSLPNWLANRLVQQFGLERATKLAEAYTQSPPIWLRGVHGQAERVESLDDEVRARIARGEVVVQDLGAQRVVELCGARPGERVLDACAGLGGKTLQLAEVSDVVAVDPSGAKLAMLTEAAARVGVQARVSAIESPLRPDIPGAPFDGVLVDAPCTGLGVIRRHPETRWRRTEPDIGRLAAVQRDLLDIAAALVRPGGWLVYSVCTWTREETSKQVEQFLTRHPRFRQDGDYLVTMPDTDDADGFFAARLLAEG